MVQNIFMKPDYEEIIKKELNMKSGDKAIIKIEPEDSSYDGYNNSNITEFVHNSVNYKFIAAEDLASSTIKNAPFPPSAVLLDVTNAELETRDTVPSEKLLDIKTECDADFVFEEIDFSEDIKPYLLPVEPNVETDDKDVKEWGLRFDPGNADTNVEQSECVDVDSCDSDEVDVTTVDNGFSTSFRVECQKMLKRKRGRPARKHRRQSSVQKEAKRRTCPAKNKGKGVKQYRSKKETMRKSVSAPTTNGTMSPNPSTSWETRARIRQLIRKYTPSPSTTSSLSSRISPSSSRSSSPSTDQLDKRFTDRRSLLEKNSLREKKRRKRLQDLKKDLRLLIPEISNKPNTTTIKLLTLSREYINKLKENQETKQKSIKHLKNKKISILKTLNNLMKKMRNDLLNSR